MGELKVKGTVKYAAGKVHETQYGQRCNVVVDTSIGELKVWEDASSGIQSLKKGQEVALIQPEGAKTWKIENPPAAPAANGVAAPTTEKPPLLETGARYLDLYTHFRAEAIARMPDASTECIMAAVGSVMVFIRQEYGIGLTDVEVETQAAQPRTPVSNSYDLHGATNLTPSDSNTQPLDPDNPIDRFRVILNWTGHTPGDVRRICQENSLPTHSKDLNGAEANLLRNLLMMDWANREHGDKFNHPNHLINSFQKVIDAAGLEATDGGIWLAWQSKVISKGGTPVMVGKSP